MSKFSKRFVSILISGLFVALSFTTAYAAPSNTEKSNISYESQYTEELDFFNEDEWQYDDTIKAASISNADGVGENFSSDIILGKTRSRSKPTELWDLTESSYNADLQEVSCINVLYTNYYFYCNDDRELYVDYSLFSNTGREVSCTIRLYDLDKKTYYDWETDYFNNVDLPESTKGAFTGGMYFYNIDIGTRYAIAFLSNKHPDSMSWDMLHGSARIHH